VVLGVASCLDLVRPYLKLPSAASGSFRPCRQGTPIASLYAIIPLSGILIGACSQSSSFVNGLVNGFDHFRTSGRR